MSRILRIACSGGSLKKGGSPSIISMTIMPRDQTVIQNIFKLIKYHRSYLLSVESLTINFRSVEKS